METCATIKLIDKVECFDFESVSDWFKAVRATSIMGFISLLVALVMTILKMFFMKDKKPIVLAAIGTAFIGDLFILISIAVYSSKVGDLTTSQITHDYHFAFVFCILAMLAAVGAGSVMVVDAVRTKSI
ncbi:uncharacterized protein LOC128168352 [Crassostrea angulata]|uniref:uncharacterized protein LOC128168352 n=1 Tax=Magallana angulata TaxID=2784310 RepID=UPI0022B0FC5B|nr:uncharacterized protein LOC128168352 [Crassostrea angulata]